MMFEIADTFLQDKVPVTTVGKCAHELYKTGDPDCPSAILDRNGEVVLSFCRKCRKGECELTES